MFLGVFYGVLVVFFSIRFRNRREKIYKIMIWPYSGQEKLKGGRVLILFFLNGLLLEDKSMSLLMEDFINHDHLLEVHLGFYKYADGGPIMDVPVE
jgi:hypothetical protein